MIGFPWLKGPSASKGDTPTPHPMQRLVSNVFPSKTSFRHVSELQLGQYPYTLLLDPFNLGKKMITLCILFNSSYKSSPNDWYHCYSTVYLCQIHVMKINKIHSGWEFDN